MEQNAQAEIKAHLMQTNEKFSELMTQHLEYKRPNEGFICPYQGCMTPLKGTMHFLNHRMWSMPLTSVFLSYIVFCLVTLCHSRHSII